MRLSSNVFALFVRSKFYLRQMISTAVGVVIGFVLSLLLAPFLDRMCMFDSRLIIGPHHNAKALHGLAGAYSDRSLQQLLGGVDDTATKPPPSMYTAKNRPHFLSHELGIRNKLLSITIMSSPSDYALVELLYRNIYPGTEASNVPYSVVSILSGQQKLISSVEQQIKANLSSFLLMRLADSLQNGKNADVAFQVGQYVEDAANGNNRDDVKEVWRLVSETLIKTAEQYRTQFDWFLLSFPQVYVRFSRLYERLLMMSPIYDRLLLVPRSAESGYSCDRYASMGTRQPFRAVLLSNKLMTDIYTTLQSAACQRQPRYENLDCLEALFQHACIPEMQNADELEVADSTSDLEFSSDSHLASSLAVYPVYTPKQYLALDKLSLEYDYKVSMDELASVREELHKLVHHLPPGENKPSWPIDVQPPLKPRQRFDIAPWQFLNASHVFFTDEYTTVHSLAGTDLEDVQGVTTAATDFVEKHNPNRYKFLSLENGYRKFDPVRGMEYLLYLLFEDTASATRNRVLKFMHVLKPLNRLEPVNAPHVTEDAVVTLVVPVFVDDSDEAEETGIAFLEQVLALLKVGDRLKLWLLLVYPSSTTAVDPFMKLKSLVADGESQFPSRLAWLSVQTSHRSSLHLFEAVVRSRQQNQQQPQQPDDWLVLMLPPESLLSREFLNRVRLMTIRGYQVYFPIAFSQFHPDLIAEPLLLSAINGASTTTAASSQRTTTTTAATSSDFANVELTSRHGHFDQYDFDTAAFYLSDYSECRQQQPPSQTPTDVADVFLACTQLHVFRAVDPGLKRLFRHASCEAYSSMAEPVLDSCRSRLEIGLGNRKHMAAKLSEHVLSVPSMAPPAVAIPEKVRAEAGKRMEVEEQRVVDEDREYGNPGRQLINDVL